MMNYLSTSLSGHALVKKILHETEYWSIGVLEYWISNASLHYSIAPVLQSLRWSETMERNAADGPFSLAGCLGLVPLVHVPATGVLPAALLSGSHSRQALLGHENLRRIVKRQMGQPVAEHLDKLELELLRSGRRNDGVQLVENRVFARIIPTRDVFESELVLRCWDILGVKPLLPFLHGNIVGSYESAGPTVAVFRGIKEPVR